MPTKNICIRMDDIGAASKRWAVYSKNPAGNILFLKYIAPFKSWGPYRELTVADWDLVTKILKKHNASMTVGITANWVERNGKRIPFHLKFPAQAQCIKRAADEGIIEVANHGLTHCVDNKHLPRMFSSNRKYHREFWSWIPDSIQENHFVLAQKYLERYFNRKIVTFIPPGNVVSHSILTLLPRYNIKYISAKLDPSIVSCIGSHLMYIDSNDIIAFHDRELVINGTNWLENKISKYSNKGFNVKKINS